MGRKKLPIGDGYTEVVRVRINKAQLEHLKKHHPKGISQWFRDKVDADIKAKARK